LELAGEAAEAEKYYRVALDLNSQFPHALYNLGTLLHAKNRHQEGDDLIARAMQADHLIGKEIETQRAVLMGSRVS
jgi:Tfp pilus assembly protein PilF